VSPPTGWALRDRGGRRRRAGRGAGDGDAHRAAAVALWEGSRHRRRRTLRALRACGAAAQQALRALAQHRGSGGAAVDSADDPGLEVGRPGGGRADRGRGHKASITAR
jgi:hypothetical protein